MKILKAEYDGVMDHSFLVKGEKVETVDGPRVIEITGGKTKVRAEIGQILTRNKNGSITVTGKPTRREEAK